MSSGRAGGPARALAASLLIGLAWPARAGSPEEDKAGSGIDFGETAGAPSVPAAKAGAVVVGGKTGLNLLRQRLNAPPPPGVPSAVARVPPPSGALVAHGKTSGSVFDRLPGPLAGVGRFLRTSSPDDGPGAKLGRAIGAAASVGLVGLLAMTLPDLLVMMIVLPAAMGAARGFMEGARPMEIAKSAWQGVKDSFSSVAKTFAGWGEKLGRRFDK